VAEWKQIITSGSDAELNNITASGGITSDLTGTASFADTAATASYISASNIDGAAGILVTPITTSLTSNVGSVEDNNIFDAGVTLESIIRQMLVEYIPPTFSHFSISGSDGITLATRLEVGDTDILDRGQYRTGSDSNNEGFTELLLTLSGLSNNSIANKSLADNIISFDSKTITRTSPGTVSFNLDGVDSQGTSTPNNLDKHDTTQFHFPIFFGGSPEELTTEDLISNGVASLNSVLADISGSAAGGSSGLYSPSNENNQSLVSTTSTTSLPETTFAVPSNAANDGDGISNFTYIVYPSSYGALTKILLDFVQSEIGTFTNLGTGDHTRFGVTTTYFVYKSAGKGPYSTSNLITIDD